MDGNLLFDIFIDLVALDTAPHIITLFDWVPAVNKMTPLGSNAAHSI